ncbi:MAG: NADH-quinone oxidoreductase subunit A [Euzebyales bacterium]|nr:NADH-quinone oxidoreductase subunit A [Euzebyales bacterium]MBA3620892.1 NADH-quinone oxidoreductase subunit A [Euzebyales bacterium]
MLVALGGALTLFAGAAFAVLVWRWLDAALDVATPSESQLVPFTGGHEPTVHAWSRFHVRYYTMAVLFLAFDMEMVFMYPWAVVYVREGFTALVEMLMFIVILLVGVLYAWREGALSWQ